MTETVLNFGVLGALQVTVDGRPVAVGTPKQRAVLAMLLINRNRPVAAESLINAAWDPPTPAGARASLHSYVHNLRKLLADAGVDARDILTSAPPGYRLDVADIECDVGRFYNEKTAGVRAAAAGRFEQASKHLSAALGEWRGSVLEDLLEFEFVEPISRALIEDKVLAHTARAEAEIACGRPYMMVGELEALTEQYPYREPLWAQLITAYYLTERQSDALEAYLRLKTTLADELGIDPGPTIRTLYERILRQEPLDAKQVALTTANDTLMTIDKHVSIGVNQTSARLRDSSGQGYPLVAVVTRIGRSPDNDIVLNDALVSRNHAAIIDTGSSFVITDLRSANGVKLNSQRISHSASLDDGDQIRIGSDDFTLEIRSG